MAIDDPVELGVLLRASDLEEVAGYYAELHKCGLAVLDSQLTGGRLAVAAGPGADVGVACELPLEAGAIERGANAYFRALLLHEGSPIGMVVVGPHEPGSDVAAERAARLAGHIRSILEVLVHAAYQRYLTSVMHVAAMEEVKWQPTPVFLPGESQGRAAAVSGVAQSRTRLKQRRQCYYENKPCQVFLGTER
ncbi:MAG TPA: hypothetical protein VML75_15570 [Kofleriaceae bacterium]|nr:hypothetical protein [Kofleriaceae bacterium]